jgi:hypothetical protein
MLTTSVPLFVNGGGMRGGPIHHTISDHPFLGERWTAPKYRFFSVGDRFPAMWLVDQGGVAVPGELYDVPLTVIRDRFIPAEPAELELGVIELATVTRRWRSCCAGRSWRPPSWWTSPIGVVGAPTDR